MQQKDLSVKLAEVGRPMLPTVISKVERCERRIDVDDLVAFALALDVSPLVLLLPRKGTGQEATPLTEQVEVSAANAWEWADGAKPLMRSENDPYGHLLRFRLDSRPDWDRDPLRAQYNDVLSAAVRRLVRAGQQGRLAVEDGAVVWYDNDGRLVDRWEPKNPPEGEH